MNIQTVKETSLIWGISVRRINVLCNQGRIPGARKMAGVWLIPADAEKPSDLRLKNGNYVNWRHKTEKKPDNFEANIKNLSATFAVEGMKITKETLKNLKRIENGEITYKDAINELVIKYEKRL